MHSIGHYASIMCIHADHNTFWKDKQENKKLDSAQLWIFFSPVFSAAAESVNPMPIGNTPYSLHYSLCLSVIGWTSLSDLCCSIFPLIHRCKRNG